jgi:hypothetical protein
MNGGQYASKTTFKIEIKSSCSRGRCAAATAATTNAGELSKRKVERIVFGAQGRKVYRLGGNEWRHRWPLDPREDL